MVLTIKIIWIDLDPLFLSFQLTEKAIWSNHGIS